MRSDIEVNTLVDATSDEMLETDSVLVAEDSAIDRSILESSLRQWNFKVTMAEDGLQAWEILQQENAPNLLVLDWMMPGLDGVELCRRIRSREAALYPYILLLTAQDQKQDVIDGLNSGADDYLTKPFDVNELQARLRAGTRILSLQNALLRQKEQLKFQASHDRLTDLWNRGAILEFLEKELSRARRTAQPLCALMIDVDHFKTVNDTYGHLTGDVVLREVARRLGASIRNYDWIGRYGGEEFLAIVSSSGASGMGKYAERLCTSISSEPIHTPAGDLEVTVSVGGAVVMPGAQLSCDGLVQAADEALYRAKNHGRNRVEFTGLSNPDGTGPHPLSQDNPANFGPTRH
jgi:two-component system cell cycle response regulator